MIIIIIGSSNKSSISISRGVSISIILYYWRFKIILFLRELRIEIVNMCMKKYGLKI